MGNNLPNLKFNGMILYIRDKKKDCRFLVCETEKRGGEGNDITQLFTESGYV